MWLFSLTNQCIAAMQQYHDWQTTFARRGDQTPQFSTQYLGAAAIMLLAWSE
jgi:hypothetical protein